MKREPYYEEPKANMAQLPRPDPVEIAPQPPEEQPSVEAESTIIRNVDQGTTTENLPSEGCQEEEPPTEPIEEHEDVTKEVEKEVYEKSSEAPQESAGTEEESPNKEQNDDIVDAGTPTLDESMETDEIEQPVSEENSKEKEVPSQVNIKMSSEAIGVSLFVYFKDSIQEPPVAESNAEEVSVLPPEENTGENVEGVDVPPTEKKDFVEDTLSDVSESFVFNDPSQVVRVDSSGNEEEQAVNVEETVPERMEVDGKTNGPQQEERGEEEAEEVTVVDEQTNAEIKEGEGQVQELDENKEGGKDENEDGSYFLLIYYILCFLFVLFTFIISF